MIIALVLDKILPKLNHSILNKEDIINYIDSLIGYLELFDFYNHTFIDNNFPDIGTYNFSNNNIKLNLTRIQKESINYFQTLNLPCSKEFYCNMDILTTIYHEVMHVFHHYVSFDETFAFSPLYRNDINYMLSLDKTDKTYDTFYNLFIMERDANISATENILYIINKYFYSKELINFYLKRIQNYMLIGYKAGKPSIFPMKTIYNNLYHIESPRIEGIDLYDKLKCGTKVKAKELNYWKKNQKSIILSKNNLQEL